MSSIRYSFFVIPVLFLAITGYSQVTTNGASGLAASFPSLADAIVALNAATISAPIVIDVNADQTAPAGGYIITAQGTAVNTITLRGNNNTVVASNAHLPGKFMDAIFRLEGADYLTLEYFVMVESPSATNVSDATNTVTEWGVALLAASLTNGCQNNIIRNNTISLLVSAVDRNTFGIYSNVRHNTTSVLSSTNPSVFSGTNSHNKIHSNNIANVNFGISFTGSGVTGYSDTGNELGGPVPGTGNSITEFGKVKSSVLFASHTDTNFGIQAINQINETISNNTLVSNDITSSATIAGVRGILKNFTTDPGGTSTSAIAKNTITLTYSATSSDMIGILNSGATAAGVTLHIVDNQILKCKLTAASTLLTFRAINNSAGVGILNITGNLVRGLTSSQTGGTFKAFENSGNVVSAININNNKIGNNEGAAVTFLGTNAGHCVVIENSGGGSLCSLSISGNEFYGFVYSNPSNSSITFIETSASSVPVSNITSNLFINLILNNAGSVFFMRRASNSPANSVHNFIGNQIIGSFTKTAPSGEIFIYDTGSGLFTGSNSSTSISNNTFSNITSSGTSRILGYAYNLGQTLTIEGNTFDNWAIGGVSNNGCLGIRVNDALNITISNNTMSDIVTPFAFIGIYTSFTGTSAMYNANQMINISAGTNLSGLIYEASHNALTISNSVIHNLTSNTGIVTGLTVTLNNGATLSTIRNNKVSDLASNGAASTVSGFKFGISSTNTGSEIIANNYIGDLTAPISAVDNAIKGIEFSSTSNAMDYTLYYNTIFISASSSGANFGASILSAVSSPGFYRLDLRNNIFVNNSTPNGTGVSTVLRNTALPIANYKTNNNHNLFSIGTPAAQRFIYYSTAVINDPSLLAFKARVYPRENRSIGEFPDFLSIDGASTDFLHIDPTTATSIENGAVQIAGYNLDFDSVIRAGNPGYAGIGSLPDIGADEGDFIQTDILGPDIQYALLGHTASLANRNLGNVAITDINGVNSMTGLKPRVYFKKKTQSNTFNDNTNATDGWKYVEANGATSPFDFDIDYALINGGSPVIGDTIQYFAIAQDIAMTPNVGLNSGILTLNAPTVALDASHFPLTNTINAYVIKAAMEGIKTVCASGCDYPSLTNAGGIFQAINNSLVTDNLTIRIEGDLTVELGTHPLNAYAVNEHILIRPFGGVHRTISGTAANGTPLIGLNGADNVTIDGINSGGDTLTISNLSTSGSAGTSTIRFINGASGNSILRCRVLGSSLVSIGSGGGVVLFNHTTTGNSNNLIENCDLGPAGANLPNVLVYSFNSSVHVNNTITGCRLYDFFSPSKSSAGIYLESSSGSGWVISNNKFYQTSSRTFTSNFFTHYGIAVSGFSGVVVNNNIIGYSSANSTGTYSLTGLSESKWFPLEIATGTAMAPTEMQGNKISNLSFSGAMFGGGSSSPFSICRIFGGVFNIGNITGNIIGDSLVNTSIAYSSSSATTSEIHGFYISGATSNVAMSNNKIGGIEAALNGTGGTKIYGIQTADNAILDCRFNTIGGPTSNSIQSLSAGGASVRGIAHFSNSSSIINDNIIRNLTSNNSASGNVNIVGIDIVSTAAHTVSRNHIFALKGTNTSGSVSSNHIGIKLSTSTVAGMISIIDRNHIHSIESASIIQPITGIQISNGINTLTNNMVRLGLKADGSSITVPCEINGVIESSGTTKLIHNSLYVGGAGVSNGTANTAAYRRSNTTTLECKNNIFSNGRQNASTGGKHYNIQWVAASLNFNIDHNVYYNTGGNGNVFGFYSATELANFQAWMTLVQPLNQGVEQNSFSENPFFISPDGTSITGDLHIQPNSSSGVESKGKSMTGVTTDADGQTRSATPDIGADEGPFGSPVISYVRLNGTIDLTNRALNAVSIVSSNGVNTTPGTKPRVYYKKKSDPNDITGWKYTESTSAASPFSFEIDYSLLNAGMVSPLDTIQYFVIAQDLSMTPSVAIEDGFLNSIPLNVNLGAAEFPITGNINSYAIKRTISGTKTICTTGCDYTSLTNNGGAFNDINNIVVTGNVVLEIQDNLVGETGTHPLNAFSSGYLFTIRPTGGVKRTIIGTSTAGKSLLEFNGADSVIVDGRNIGGDSLFITNTSTSATIGTSTIQFRNDSRSCTIRNCMIAGASTASFCGTVYVTENSLGAGNDNIKLIKNTIGAVGSNTPVNAIYIGSAVGGNNNTVIDSNYIKDYFIASGGSCSGITVNGSCPNTVISNNHFFQTVPRSKTGGQSHYVIRVGSNTTITGNTIGGSNPSNGGTYAFAGVSTSKMYPIYIGTGPSDFSTVTGNIIKNISLSGSMNGDAVSSSPFSAIYLSTGIGNISGNLIGDTTTTGSITYTTTSTSGSIVIGIGNFLGGNLTANNNAMGGITLTQAGTGGIGFKGIVSNVGAGFTLLSKHNIIGGNVPESIQNNSTVSGGSVIGIEASAGLSIIDSNTIRNLKGTGFFGIYVSLGLTNSIRHNQIYNLQINGTGGESHGIYVTVPTTSNTIVEGNKIHSLIPGGSASALNGIKLQGGTVTVSNNMIRLGLKDDGTSFDGATNYTGIYASAAFESNIYFNSVYIGGDVTGTAAINTYCARVDNSLKNIRNNVFYNARSNLSTGGKHYALSLANITGLTEDHNLYYVTGTNGILASVVNVDKSNIEGLRNSTFQDFNSHAADPKFINPTGNATLFDLHIDPALISLAEGNGVAIPGFNIDYDNESRSSLSPVDIGADAGNFMGEDKILPVITYSDLSVDYAKLSRPFSNIQITDANGIDTTAGLRPRFYFKKSTDPNTDSGWKYVEANGTSSPFDFTINYSLLTAGSVSPGDVIQYFVVAADTATVQNVGKHMAVFSLTPASVALMSAQFPIGGTIKSFAIIDTLTGTRTVCASGCDFSSLTNNDAGGAFKAINDRILTGNLLLQITSDLTAETGAVSLSAFAAPFTVTIKPDGAPRLVSYSGASSLIVLNGADRVTIDGSLSSTTNTLCPLVQATRDLTFKNLNASASIINLRSAPGNPSTNNVIKNCNIEGNTASTTIFGIISADQTVTNSSLGKDNDNNAFINNAISKVQYGIFSQGESRSNKNQGTIINLNVINLASTANTAVAGIYIGLENGAQLSGNTIINISNATKSVAGIVLGLLPTSTMTVFTGNDVTNSVISLNSIHDVTRMGDGSAFGITMASVITGGTSTNELSNNVLYNIRSTAATAMDYIAGILVGGGPVGTTKVYYNTVKISGVSAHSAPGFAMAIGTVNPIVEMKNNIFVNEMTAALGKNYALGLAYSGSYSNLNSNKNNFFTPGAPIATTGGLNNSPAGDLVNLAAYQTLTGKDLNSKNILPEFVSSTDLHLTTGAINLANLDAKGAPVSVTADIDCEIRHATTPDIGADEIAGCNNPLITSVSADVNPIPCSGNATNLTVAGNLNQGTEWKWYTGSCGGTLVGSGLTIAVMPEASTIYYVRGEGGCTSDGPCDSIAISITGAMITNTNNGGAGSLREALTCAGDGDTLVFDPGVLDAGDTIIISSAALIIGKDIFIDQDPSSIVKIMTMGTHPVFNVNAGSSLTLRNVKLFVNAINPGMAGRAMVNHGMLTLNNVDIFERDVNASGIGSTVQNQSGSILTIIAGCQLKIQ